MADHSSFSAAARVVHRSQSRVSAHVAALERALGTSLIDRRHRPVELTDAGEAFLPHARETLASLDRGAAAVDSLSGVRRGRVVVGAHPSVSAQFLPGVLRDFSTSNPQVHVALTEDTTVGLGEGLFSGRLHLAIRSTTAPMPAPGLRCLPLWSEPYVVVVRQSHPLTRCPRPLHPDQLADLDFIAIGQPGSGMDPDTRAVLDRWGVAPEVRWRTEQPQTLANLVKAGLGVGLINRLAMECSETTGLAVLEVGGSADGRSVGLWSDPERYMSSATHALHDAITSATRPRGTLPVHPQEDPAPDRSGASAD